MGNIDLNDVMKQADENTPKPNEEKKKSFGTRPFRAEDYINDSPIPPATEKRFTIRLLPFEPGASTPFHKIYCHYVKVKRDERYSSRDTGLTEWKKFICLKNDPAGDGRCPYCELSAAAFEESRNCESAAEREQYLDTGKINRAKEFWVVRCIERGKENDGVKFWRFQHNPYRANSIYNQIIGIAKQRQESARSKGKDYNIFDLYNGKDLMVTVRLDENGRRSYNIVDDDERTPLSEDQAQIEAWVNDAVKWTDVYHLKSYEYLRIYAEGDVPMADPDNKGQVIGREAYQERKKAEEEARKEAEEKAKAEAEGNIKALDDKYSEPAPAPADPFQPQQQDDTNLGLPPF
jgi:hypothetical protein